MKPPMNADDENALLQKCPWCGYSLRGLPIRHCCPECGRPFHRQAKVFRNMSPQLWRLLAGVGCFGFIWMKARAAGGRGWSWLASLRSSAGIVTLLLIAVLSWTLVRQFRRRKIFVYVDPDSVFVCNRGTGDVMEFQLVDIYRADTDRLGRLTLHLADQVVTTEMIGGMFSQAFACAAYVNWQSHIAISNRPTGESSA